MSQVKWITKAGTLGSFAEEIYVEFELDAYDTSGLPLEYEVIAGKLSSGLQLFHHDVYDKDGNLTFKAGTIQGIPVIENTEFGVEDYKQTFTIRAQNKNGIVADRTFNIIVNSLAPPQIIPKNISLGTYYDGFYLDLTLQAIEPNPTAILSWTVISGDLPIGVTLAANGRMSGFIMPFTSPVADGMLGWGNAGWNVVPWDAATAVAQSKSYTFKVRVFDGAKTDETNYSINVLAKSLFTVDHTNIPVNTTLLTADIDDKHNPIIITLPQSLPEQRQQSNFAFKIDGIDLDGGTVFYDIILQNPSRFDEGLFDELLLNEPPTGFDQEDNSLPPGLLLDPVSGWLFGNLEPQAEERKTYTFQVYCYKIEWFQGSPYRYKSTPVTFKLTVLGSLYNVVDWQTPNYLGVIDNGDISEFFIEAKARLPGKELNFRLKEGLPIPKIDPASGIVRYTPLARSKLPQGLKLLPDGLIVGRPTFDYFSLDSGATTIDKGNMNFDFEYTFTITASDETNTHPLTVSADKTFTIRIKNYNKKPYENVYMRALPSKDQRTEFENLINNTDIFPTELLYRASDKWFGTAPDIKFLFAAGMNPNHAATYIAAMQDHHFNKRIVLGNVKTAVALDENFKVKYEVVYVEVIDSNSKVAYSVDRYTEVSDQYKTDPFSVVYPNSFENMKTEISELAYSNRGALPKWMLDQQPNGRVLGFVRGVVLAYTKPGASKLIAYRLQHDEFKFNTVDFVADRYQLDHYLSKNYDIDNGKFIDSHETTFDRLEQIGGIYRYAGTKIAEDTAEAAAMAAGLSPAEIEDAKLTAVLTLNKIAANYAVSIPFDQINGRTTKYVAEKLGLVNTVLKQGQYIMFVKQENFPLNVDETIDNDGWNSLTNAYGSHYETPYGYNDMTYEQVAAAAIIPGYREKIMTGSPNQRGGIWKVNVTPAGIVLLEFAVETSINEYVQIAGGYRYGETKLVYNPIVSVGGTVPSFTILGSLVSPEHKTTYFDMGATRFYNNRDMYAEPESEDIWLKFPKHNIYI